MLVFGGVYSILTRHGYHLFATFTSGLFLRSVQIRSGLFPIRTEWRLHCHQGRRFMVKGKGQVVFNSKRGLLVYTTPLQIDILNLNITQLNRKNHLNQTSIFRFHANFLGVPGKQMGLVFLPSLVLLELGLSLHGAVAQLIDSSYEQWPVDPGSLLYVGDESLTHLYGDYFISHEIRIFSKLSTQKCSNSW